MAHDQKANLSLNLVQCFNRRWKYPLTRDKNMAKFLNMPTMDSWYSSLVICTTATRSVKLPCVQRWMLYDAWCSAGINNINSPVNVHLKNYQLRQYLDCVWNLRVEMTNGLISNNFFLTFSMKNPSSKTQITVLTYRCNENMWNIIF